MTLRWLKITLVMTLELSSLWPLDRTYHSGSMAAYVALHAMASVISAWLVWSLLPVNYQTPARPAYAMIFCFAFLIPGFGVLAIVAAIQIAHCYPKTLRTAHYATITSLKFSEVQREATKRSDLRVGDARRILKNPSSTVEIRLQLLVALKSMRPKATMSLLHSLLGDPSEDIRLVAHSMVEACENGLAKQIEAAMHSLHEALDREERTLLLNALQRLAELSWLQIDNGLASHDLRRFALDQAKKCCEYALILDDSVSSVWLLYARVLIELDRLPEATSALWLARKAHMPEQEIWPMLAQIAFLRRDFENVRKYMGRLPENAQLPHKLRGLASFWRQQNIARLDPYV
jgi:polysaccharide biosynthesis protein PelE